MSLYRHLARLKDPTLLAVLCEDAAACAGVLVVGCGMRLSLAYENPLYDAGAGVAVGVLLGAVGGVLATLNGRYLIGAAVEDAVLVDIERTLRRRPSVDDVHAVQSQRVGPDAFAYKCEVDFDGTWVAAQLLDKYAPSFEGSSKEALAGELPTLLSFYAEDVMRAVEAEVRDIEAAIRERHPDARYIEIEPDARARGKFGSALDEGLADVAAERRLLDSSVRRSGASRLVGIPTMPYHSRWDQPRRPTAATTLGRACRRYLRTRRSVEPPDAPLAPFTNFEVVAGRVRRRRAARARRRDPQ